MRGRKRFKQESLLQFFFFFRANSCRGGEGQTKAVCYKTRNKNKRSRLDLTNTVPYHLAFLDRDVSIGRILEELSIFCLRWNHRSAEFKVVGS